MPLHVIGLNHVSAPLDVREKVAFPAERQAQALSELAAQPGVAEAVLVSTCNRTEIYFRADNAATARAWLEAEAAKAGLDVAPHLYAHTDEAAVRHAFRVACGLDSMVLGEPQILGQVKQSVRAAESAGTLGHTLGNVFRKTFSVAKQVRTETALGGESISMAAAALRLAQNIFGDLSRTRMVLVGVGEMVELAATYFVAQRPASVKVANRTLARGEEFAERFGGTAISLAELADHLHEFDIVVTGTASTLPILGKGMFERALKARRRRPIFVVDFAVPRDVEPEVSKLEDVFLYTIDDLSSIIKDNLQIRRESVAQAEEMIATQAQSFVRWLEGRTVVPTITALQGHHNALRNAELERARKLLAGGTPPAEVLDQLARGLTNKFLHAPTQALNKAGDAERAELVAMFEKIYQLPFED